MICFSLLMFITLYFYKISFVLPDKPVDLYCFPLHATKIVIPKIMKKNMLPFCFFFAPLQVSELWQLIKGIKTRKT